MLTAEENERLSRIEGEAPMGQLVRRFWIPFQLSADLPENDCVPVRCRLLGEDLVAFRDTRGRVGLIEPFCAHRRADLFYGRNEEDGIRCIYHGWKYDYTGQCVETPTEPGDSNFKLTVRLKSYPVVERAGICWTYMGQARPGAIGETQPGAQPGSLGPGNGLPDLPDFEFLRVPEGHLHVSWSTQDCNFVQAIEGGIDTMHSVFLHSTLDSHRKLDEYKKSEQRLAGSVPQSRYRTRDNPAILSAADTDYGVVVGGRYPGDAEGDYWRYNLFLMPFFSMPPGGADSKLCHAFVPLDDYVTARWSFTWQLGRPYNAREQANLRLGSGVHAEVIPGTHMPVRRRDNDYLVDREEQRTLTFTGIKGTGEQDFAVQEGMGKLVDRTRERLGVSDVGINQMRKHLLKAADDLAHEGVEPYAASHPEVFRIHAGDTMLPADETDWVGAEKAREALAAKW